MPKRRTREPQMLLGVSMNKREAQSFLRKLADDDSFRRRLRSNPGATLADAGVMISEELIPARIVLPTKAQMKEFLATGKPWDVEGPAFAPCRCWAVLYAIAAQAK